MERWSDVPELYKVLHLAKHRAITDLGIQLEWVSQENAERDAHHILYGIYFLQSLHDAE